MVGGKLTVGPLNPENISQSGFLDGELWKINISVEILSIVVDWTSNFEEGTVLLNICKVFTVLKNKKRGEFELFVCLFDCLSVGLSVCYLSVCLAIIIYLSSLLLSICLSFCPSIHLYADIRQAVVRHLTTNAMVPILAVI